MSHDKLMIPPVIIICHGTSLVGFLTSTQFQFKMWMPRLYGSVFQFLILASLVSFTAEMMDVIFCTLHHLSI